MGKKFPPSILLLLLRLHWDWCRTIETVLIKVFYVGLIISQDLPDHKLETLYECDSLPELTFIGRQTLLILPCEILFPIGREGLRCYLCCNGVHWLTVTPDTCITLFDTHSFIPGQPHDKHWPPLQQKLPCVQIHFLLLQHVLQRKAICKMERKRKRSHFSPQIY